MTGLLTCLLPAPKRKTKSCRGGKGEIPHGIPCPTSLFVNVLQNRFSARKDYWEVSAISVGFKYNKTSLAVMSLWDMLGQFSSRCFPCPKWVPEPPRYWLFGYKLISHLSLKRFWFHQTERERLNSSCFQQMCIWIACAEKKTQPDLGLPAQCLVHWNSGLCWRSVSFLFTAAIKGKEEESLFNKNPFHKTSWKASVINRTQSKTFVSEADRDRSIRNTEPSRSGTPTFSNSQGFDANWLPAEFYTRKPWSQSCIWLRDGTVNGAPTSGFYQQREFSDHFPLTPIPSLCPWVRRSRDPEESHRPKSSHKQVLLSLKIFLLPSLPPKYLPLH